MTTSRSSSTTLLGSSSSAGDLLAAEGLQPDFVHTMEENAYNNNNLIDSASPIRTRIRQQEVLPPLSTRHLSIDQTSEEQPSSSPPSSTKHMLKKTMYPPADDKSSTQRLVAVRYFLDRPGYGLHNSACRMWFDPPAFCQPSDLRKFLQDQGIALDDLLVEVYLDRFQSFMLLDACEAANIEWDLQDTNTSDAPGILNIRLTDVGYAQRLDNDSSSNTKEPQQQGVAHQGTSHANTTPVGLFSFSMMVGLETALVMEKLLSNGIEESVWLAAGPYMFFVGGLLQIITGSLQVFRNNIYGAVAFLGFGSFWFSNGTRAILEKFFAEPGSQAYDLLLDGRHDDWGTFIRASYILAFTFALLKQTFVMSKLSTTLITLLCCKIFFQSIAGFSEVLQWIQVGFGWITSWFAFYVFLVEFTNQVYHREVFKTYKWSEKDSPEELFGAAGRSRTLYSKAAKLRQARFPNISGVRSAMANAAAVAPDSNDSKAN